MFNLAFENTKQQSTSEQDEMDILVLYPNLLVRIICLRLVPRLTLTVMFRITQACCRSLNRLSHKLALT